MTTILEVVDNRGNLVAVLGPQTDPVVVRPVAETEGPTSNGGTSFLSQGIFWDRDGGAFSGNVELLATTDLENPAGVVMDSASLEALGLVINPYPLQVRSCTGASRG